MFEVVVCAFVEKSTCKAERSHWLISKKNNRAKEEKINGFPQEKPGRKREGLLVRRSAFITLEID